MKIEILRPTVANGVAVEAGDIVEVDKGAGNFLVAIGKAVEYVEPRAVVEPVAAEPVSVEPEAKPAPKRRGRKPKKAVE